MKIPPILGVQYWGYISIRTDFNELYRQMNGMPLREMDNIIYPVCRLCRDHERTGFVEATRVGIHLTTEIK